MRDVIEGYPGDDWSGELYEQTYRSIYGGLVDELWGWAVERLEIKREGLTRHADDSDFVRCVGDALEDFEAQLALAVKNMTLLPREVAGGN